MAMISEDKYVQVLLDSAAEFHERLETLRWGQCFSMALDVLNHEVANQMVGTPHDCFYQDDLIPAFIAKSKELYYSRPERDA